jgi:hypothetical protein
VLWFVVVFVFFSSSGTQLPHYLLYGCTPVFILLAKYRPTAERRWLAVPLVLLRCYRVLPEILAYAAAKAGKPFRRVARWSGCGLLRLCLWLLPLMALGVIGLALWRSLPVWQGMYWPGCSRRWWCRLSSRRAPSA